MCTLLCFGCGEAPVGQDAGSTDAARPQDGGTGERDSSAPCGAPADCDDGVFCNGAELCDPGSPDADARGCVAVGSPCLLDQTCNEESDHCDTECDRNPDADGDGHAAIDCGGADCADDDANRYPGNTEFCDTAHHDEDCDPTTFGFRDGDMDDEPDARCCNMADDGTLTCGSDCDDTRPSVSPTATEVCNGRDDDCDGSTDEEVLETFYVDADGDGRGTDDTSVPTLEACTLPATGYARDRGDCDDTVSTIYRGAVDTCDAAMLDEDCNGTPNDPPGGCACTSGDPPRPCAGAEGICAAGNEACIGGMWGSCSVMATAESCNGLDDDCDGSVDDGVRVTCYADGDGDRYAASGAVASGQCPVSDRPFVGGCPVNYTNRAPFGADEDCNDSDAAMSPVALEVCDARDNDCDTMVDEGVGVTCYADNDGDTYASMGAPPLALCPVSGRTEYGNCPFGYTARTPAGVSTSDCADGVASTYPGALEACDGVDNDCNGIVDDGMRVVCWADGDDDGYAPAGAAMTMECPVSARTAVGGCPMNMTNRDPSVTGQADCEDTMAAIRPGAVELCDGIDNDCNGVDDAARVTCWPDADNDTYAPTGASSSMQCPDAGRTTVGLCPLSFTNRDPATAADCADSNASVHPGATEMCQVPAFDQNCNGDADEGQVTCFPDTDGDGFAATGATPLAPHCPMVGGYGGCVAGYTTRDPAIAGNADCAPTDPSVHPLAAEICDAIDNNCNGANNEAPVSRWLYRDQDEDGYGAGSLVLISVSDCVLVPVGYSTVSTDCNDWSTDVRPSATAYRSAPTPSCPSGAQPRCQIGSTWYCQVGDTCDAGDPAAAMGWDYNCDGTETREQSASCGGGWDGRLCADVTYLASCQSSLRGLGWYTGTPPCGSSIPGRECACAVGGNCTLQSSGSSVVLRCR